MTTKRNDWRATIGQMTLMGLRYLNGRRLRTTLTTLSIVFGVALIFAINLALPSMIEAFRQSVTAISGADIRITSTSGSSFTPESALPLVEGVDQVKAVTGILSRQYTIPVLEGGALGSTAQIQLIGVDPTSAQAVRPFAMSEGRFLEAGDSGKAVLPAGIADFAPELKVGTVFPLITAGGLKLYTVVGFLAEAGSPSAPEIYIPLEDAQAAFNQPGLINTIEIATEAGADREAVTAAVQQVLGDGFQLAAESNATDVVGAMQVGFAIFNLLGVLALFLGAFLIFNTFRTVILERRHDLAMLRTIGATRRQIMWMILIESLLQGVIGTAIGLVLGYLMTVGLFGAIGSIYETYLNRPLPPLQFTPAAFGMAIILGLLTALAAGYWPARAAGRTSPLDALRPTSTASIERSARWNLIAGVVLMALSLVMLVAGAKTAAGGAMLFLIGMMIAAPGLVIPASRLFSPLLTLWFAREGDLARGNLVRQPGRAAITGGTLMIGLAVLVLSAAIVTAFSGLVDNLADRSFSSDIVLMPQSIAVYNNVIGADESLAERLRALPDIAAVGTLRYASSSASGHAVQVLGIDPVEYPKVASFDFAQGEEAEAFKALQGERTAFVTSIGQTTIGVNLGDDIVLQTAEGPQSYRVVGVANDILTFKVASVFISHENLAADFHKREDVLLMANLVPGADKDAALAEVQTIVQDYPQFTASLTGEYRETLVTTTSGAMLLFYFLALLIIIPAAMGLLNTLTINILERTREIGVVRAVGGSQKQVRRMVTAESLLLGIFGSAMGVLSGVAISYGFISAFGAVGWTMPFTFPLMGIIAAVVLGVLLALFASILPARSAARLEIIRALQYE